jgi:hypothetical protein
MPDSPSRNVSLEGVLLLVVCILLALSVVTTLN